MKRWRIYAFKFSLLILAVTLVGYEALGNTAPTGDEKCLRCHGHQELLSRKGSSRFIDPDRFMGSVHSRKGIGCVSCHDGVESVSSPALLPHSKGKEPKCNGCHERVSDEYEKSLHHSVSKKICYSCHNPHYTISFRQLSGDQRKEICLKCHDTGRTHKWLPHKDLHFSYLECASCHSVNAQIGLTISLVNKSEKGKEEVLTYQQLERFLDPSKNLVQTLDSDGNGHLSQAEIHHFFSRVRNGGIADASLSIRILVLSPNHNYSSRGERTQDCTLCHSTGARFYSKILLEAPEPEGGFRTIPIDRDILMSQWQLPLTRDFFLVGETKIRKEDLEELWDVATRIGFRWIDLIGAMIILSAVGSVSFHALLMFVSRKARKRSGKFDYSGRMPPPVLVWHWFHGLCVILLVMTGIQMRLPDILPIFAKFLNAVNLHNLMGVILIINYLIWVLYHVAKREFKTRFFISPSDFFQHVTEMIHYYGYLIFVGGRFPERCSHYSPFDPLERAFFLTTMFLLVPIQALSGVLLLYMSSLMSVIEALGGLRVIDAIHLICGYFMIAFLIIHTYFHTLKKYNPGGTHMS